MKLEDLFNKCATKYGNTKQLLQLNQECVELAKEIISYVIRPPLAKFKKDRKFLESVYLTAIAEEITDVKLMIEQIEFFFPQVKADAKQIRKEKIQKLIKKVNEK